MDLAAIAEADASASALVKKVIDLEEQLKSKTQLVQAADNRQVMSDAALAEAESQMEQLKSQKESAELALRQATDKVKDKMQRIVELETKLKQSGSAVDVVNN